jgi:type I restriction enzyme R subunit
MEDRSDPNQIYNLQARLNAFGILQQDEIDRFVGRFLGNRQAADERPVLEGIVRQAVARFEAQLAEDEQEEFRQLLASFLCFYSFIAQVVSLQDTGLEKLHLYGSWLKRLLPSRAAPEGEDITDDMLQMTAYRLQDQGVSDGRLQRDDTASLSPIDRFGANAYTEEEQRALSEIIDAFNARHGTNFTQEDYIRFGAVNDAILDDEAWVEILRNNAPEVVKDRFNAEFMRRAIHVFQRDNQMGVVAEL